MKKRTSGYRGMLRDRCPQVVNYALKWLKAKEIWIEHVYRSQIAIAWEDYDKNNNKILSRSDCKNHLVRLTLGIKNGKIRNFVFNNTIDWDNCTKDEEIYWKRISSWVTWFQSNYAYIENMYIINKNNNVPEFDIKVKIIQNYLKWLLPKNTDTKEEKEIKLQYVDKFVDFLIKCFNKQI